MTHPKALPRPEGAHAVDANGIVTAIDYAISSFPRDELIKRLAKADLAYYRKDFKKNEEQEAGTAPNNQKEVTDFPEHITPVVAPNVEADVAYYYNTFLSSPEVFQVMSNSRTKNVASAVQALNEQHSRHTDWKRNLTNVFRDAAKYNLCAAELTWKSEVSYTLGVSADFKTVEPKPVNWTGNAINHICPYNVFYDTHVPPADVAKKGIFVGKIELMAQVALHQLLENVAKVDPAGLQVASGAEGMDMVYKSACVMSDYREPDYASFTDTGVIRKQDMMWEEFAPQSDNKSSPRNRHYQVTTAYYRLIPSQWGIKTASPHDVQVWKFIIVNKNYLVFAAPMTNAHKHLGIVLAQPLEDSLGHLSESPSQQVTDIQRLISKLNVRRLAVIDEALDPTKVYNPSHIDGSNLKIRSVSKNIPLKSKPSNEQTDVRSVLMPLPTNLGVVGDIRAEVAGLQQQAQDATGINNAQQGKFQKGNKTLEEFNRTMGNSEAKQFLRAAALDNQMLSAIKYMIKVNILQYVEAEELVIPSTGEVVQIEPDQLRKAMFDFKIADGLNPASSILDGQTLREFIQLQLQVPQLAQEYDIQATIEHLLLQTAGIDIKGYRYTPEQKQAMQQQAAAAAAANGEGNPPEGGQPPQ